MSNADKESGNKAWQLFSFDYGFYYFGYFP